MITIITNDNRKVKFDGIMEFPSYSKRNFKEETTIYGVPKQNYTSRGITFKIEANELDEATLSKIIEIFYGESSVMVKNNENGKLYHNMIFADKDLSPSEKFSYDKNGYFYSFSLSMKSAK